MDTSYFDDVIGHENIKEQLRRFLAQGRLPHAMIFAGPEGLGKCLLARALASVFAKRPALVHTSNLVCDETHLTLDDGDYVFMLTSSGPCCGSASSGSSRKTLPARRSIPVVHHQSR